MMRHLNSAQHRQRCEIAGTQLKAGRLLPRSGNERAWVIELVKLGGRPSGLYLLLYSAGRGVIRPWQTGLTGNTELLVSGGIENHRRRRPRPP